MSDADTTAFLIGNVLDRPEDHFDKLTINAVMQEAERFAAAFLREGGKTADAEGCRVENGRVLLPDCQHRSWRAFVENGWNHLATPEAFGGQALPLTIATAVQMIFDAFDRSLGMLALNQRCATRMLQKVAAPEIQAVWLPRLASGEWGATICISEPEAGSDVGRIRTQATPDTGGRFRISGQKCWISYGDHDLTQGVVHFILARQPGMPPGTRGLTLFLLADRLEDGSRNAVSLLRIEEKLGLHASPTCVLAFDGALATPLSAPGRGLPALFEMICVMRLGVAAQASAVARQAAKIAWDYAVQRAQGGPPNAPPVPIHRHAEVRRTLLEMALAAESMTALTLQAAAWMDAGDQGDTAAMARATVLLPVVKALAAETAFQTASQAMQVLGGAGYTQEWPVECLLRDARVFSIYEGTTAIQALDLTFRHILGAGRDAAADVLDRMAPAAWLRTCLEETAARLRMAEPAAQERGALPLLRLFGLACIDGLLRRHAVLGGPSGSRFAALLAVHQESASQRAAWLRAQAAAGSLDQPFEVLLGSPA